MRKPTQLMSLMPNGSIIRRDGDNYTLSFKGGPVIYKSLPNEDISNFLNRFITNVIYLQARGFGRSYMIDKILKNSLKTSK